jgi:hypothetical protein
VKRLGLLGALVVTLCGCQKKTEEAPAAPAGIFGKPSGRYVGVGHYMPGRLWKQLVHDVASKDPAASRLDDDEEIIAVLDSKTGELRQCGNLSGYCISMNPWANPLTATQRAPIPLTKHARQLDEEAEAKAQPDTRASEEQSAAE